MAELNTSIYQNQPNPLANLTGILGIANAAQQNQLMQQTQQIRQYELRNAQTKGLIDAMGSISSVPGTTKEQILSRGLDYMRATGSDPNVFHSLTEPLRRGQVTPQQFGDYMQAQQMGTGGYGPVTGPPVQTPQGVSPSAITAAEFQRQRRAAGGAPQAVGLTPEEATTQAGESTEGIKAKSADLNISADWQNRKLTQSKIIELLHKGGDRLQGLTTDEITNLKNLMVGYGATDPNAASAVEQLRKYYQRNIESNSTQANTDYARAGAVIGNPNIKLTDASAKQLAMMDTLMSRLIQAQHLENQDVRSRYYQKARANFNQNQDLYAYGMDMLGPRQQREHINSLFPAAAGVSRMNDARLKEFLKSADTAVKSDGTPTYPQWQKFRNSLAIAHKYQQLDMPQISE